MVNEARGAGTPPDVRRARTLARILDAAVGIPGTPVRLGLDAILGLVPGAGDLVGAALSGYIVLIAARSGVPRAVLGRMLLNIVIDTGIGAIPILGDVFDVAWKSNLRNVALLERFAAHPDQLRTESRRFGAAIVFVLLLLLIAIAAGAVLLTRLAWHALTT